MHLEVNETIVRIIRKHPFYVIIETIGLLLLALIPIWINFTLNYLKPFIESAPLNDFEIASLGWSPLLAAFLYSLWLLSLWLVFITIFSDYYLDKWVVTNKRIVGIEQRGFFSRETSSIRFDRIQDITATISGPISTLLNFGSLSVQSAGAEQEFTLVNAPKPLLQKEFILAQKQAN